MPDEIDHRRPGERWAVMQELAITGPNVLLAFFALLVFMFLAALVIALRNAEPGHRPEIIRALAELMAFGKKR
ncbi:hypothetical protein OG280_24995 [Streptomyces virginiae]|uniref:hypothetical protein n=2 Tax=Streptomyces virginiae TaxID=1961 RepID=UPI00308CC929|nr:hypothetical protein OHA56_16135 [Streptomyces virginiae]